MNRKLDWSTMVESRNQKNKSRTPVVIAAVVGVYALATGAFLFLQGCGTMSQKKTKVEPPPAPLMPPKDTANQNAPQPVLQPPVAVEPAPAIVEPSASSTYTVGKGDSLSLIAYRYGVSSREIAELNNIKNQNQIRVGQKLLLPNYARTEPLASPKKSTASRNTITTVAAPVTAPVTTTTAGGTYVVKAGDSLSKIASRNGIKVQALRDANSLKSDVIRIGQKLVIPGAAASAPAATTEPAAPAPVIEPVPAIEAAPAAPVADATAANSVVNPQMIPTDMPFEYTVQAGETLDDIARKFAVLKSDVLTLNGITDEASVQAGQKIKIPLSNP